MKTLSICFSTLLFALLSSASPENLVRDADPHHHRYLPRGDVLIPPACYTRKTPPGRVSHSRSRGHASTRTFEYESSSSTSSVFDRSSSSDIPLETSSRTSVSSSRVTSSVSASIRSSEILDFETARSSSRRSSSASRSTSDLKVNYATAIGAEPSANNAIIVNSLPTAASNDGKDDIVVNSLPTITANDAIVVNSVPTPVSGTKGKRSSHRSHERLEWDSDPIRLSHSDSITVIETSYVPFDWSRWNDLCSLTGGRRFAFGDDLGCSSWKGFDGSFALDARAPPCLQQQFADIMITYAKRHGGKHRRAWIKEVLKYRRHPRKVVKVLGVYPSTPYCLDKPHNPELLGVWNSQLKGVDFGIYGGPNYDLKAFGDQATCPYGYKTETDSCGCVLDIDFKEERKSYSDKSGHELNGVADCLQKCTSKYRPFK